MHVAHGATGALERTTQRKHTMSQNIETITNKHANIAKAVRSHKRNLQALFLSLCDYLDKAGMTDAQKERAKRASTNVGRNMLKTKEALPSDPNKLRMWVESAKHKLNALEKEICQDKSHTLHCQRAAIVKDLQTAKEFADLFVAEYNEHKTNVAKAA